MITDRIQRIAPSLLAFVVSAALLLLCGGIGVFVLAMFGWAQPVPSMLVGAGIWAILTVLWRPDLLHRSPPARDRVPTAVLATGLVIIAVVSVINLVHNNQHVRITRDMDVYAVAGFTIANTGSSLEEARFGGLENAPGLSITGSGQSAHKPDDTKVESQGGHLLPSLYAVGQWIGGIRGVQAVTSVIGAAALTVFFVLALGNLRPWTAVAVTAGLAVNFVFVYAVRSGLSEPLSLLVVMLAIWLLLDSVRRLRIGGLLVSGFIAGTVTMTRVDGGVAVVALPPIVALACSWTASGSMEMRSRRWAGVGVIAYVAGLLASTAIAFFDLRRTNRAYLKRLGDQIGMVGLALGLASGIAILIVIAWPRIETAPSCRVVAWLRHRRDRIATGGALLVGALSAALWWIRPLLGPEHSSRLEESGSVMAGIQEREGFEPDATRTYAEVLMERFGWYLGPITLLLAAVGLAILMHRVLRRSGRDPGAVLLAVLAPTAMLYFWQPHIYPDQPWMMRRYLPVVFPLFLIAAGIAGDALIGVVRRAGIEHRRVLSGTIAVALAGTLTLAPLRVSWPARGLRWQAGGYSGLQEVCDAIGPDATVLISNHESLGILLVPSVRSFCRVPAARPHPAVDDTGSGLELAAVREAVDEAGRRLWVVGSTPERLAEEFPGAGAPHSVTILDTTQLAGTLNHPPGRTVPRRLVVFLAPVEA